MCENGINSKILISISCISYNHESYIRDTKEQWQIIQSNACVPKEPYMLMYCLEVSKR